MTTAAIDVRVSRAYATCEAITRTQARNFHYGIRLLPPERRAALCAVYALARRVDDIGDEHGDTADKRAALAALRAQVAALPECPADDPVLVAVADAARRHPIPLGAFGELVDGVDADVTADATAARTGTAAAPYRTFDDLLWYCRCVAGSVGRLCLGVFGTRPGADATHDARDRAAHLADTLGLALQQTNILRDIREDLLGGRIYLPADELAAAGVTLRLRGDGALDDPDGALADLVRDAAHRARAFYAEGLELVPLLDRRSAACTTAMAGIYRQLLDDIAGDPRRVYDRRLSLSGRQKALVAARALTGWGR